MLLIILSLLLLLTAPKVFADLGSNTDFNPFPQMEKDLNNTNDNTAEPSPVTTQNDDWPPSNNDIQINSGSDHE